MSNDDCSVTSSEGTTTPGSLDSPRSFESDINNSINHQIQGESIVALVTPIKSNFDIDFDKLNALINWHMESGTAGIVVLGTTGESTTISQKERSLIISTAVHTANNRIPIIVGTGTICPLETIRMTREAKELGAAAALIITPYYVKPPQRALITHFESIADAVDFPIIMYNCPGRTGVDL